MTDGAIEHVASIEGAKLLWAAHGGMPFTLTERVWVHVEDHRAPWVTGGAYYYHEDIGPEPGHHLSLDPRDKTPAEISRLVYHELTHAEQEERGVRGDDPDADEREACAMERMDETLRLVGWVAVGTADEGDEGAAA